MRILQAAALALTGYPAFATARDFLAAYGLGDAAARKRLKRATSTAAVELRRR